MTERKLVFTEQALKTPIMGSTWLANARCMEAVPIFRPAVDIPASSSVFRTEVGEFTEVARRPVTRFENKARHCCIGAAFSNSSYSGAEDLLRDAELALYRGKRTGKARCEVFDATMYATAVRRLRLETDLLREEGLL